MSRIVCVHGIGHQFVGEATIRSSWWPSIQDGLTRAGAAIPRAEDIAFAFYGDLFRPKGAMAGVDALPPYTAADVRDEEEQEILWQWWSEAALADQSIPGPMSATMGRTPGWIQRALTALSRSKFFADVALRAMIFDLKQVSTYMRNASKRKEMRDRVREVITTDTRVIVGHSLGSVVAYEAMFNPEPGWAVRTLVTLGSPLGIRNAIFDRLVPAPVNRKGHWPPGVQYWFNIADAGDVVALTKQLAPLFNGGARQIQDRLVVNGATAHNAAPYLTAQETGNAINSGLAG